MPAFKTILKAFTPPIIALIFNRFKKRKYPPHMWAGNYSSWQQVMAHCTGYDDGLILEKCKNSLLKVKSGEAVYERDSVVFNKKQYSWGLLATLQNCFIATGELNVLDFGGSLGSTYYQNIEFLNSTKKITWGIVEQSNFVICGQEYFEDEQLKFYYSPEECIIKQHPNILLLSGVLQYLENPYQWIEKFIALKVPNIIIDRTAFISGDHSRLTLQNVPDKIYQASYPCWFFNEHEFLNAFSEKYNLIAEFNSYADSPMLSDDGKQMYWKGYFLKIKD